MADGIIVASSEHGLHLFDGGLPNIAAGDVFTPHPDAIRQYLLVIDHLTRIIVQGIVVVFSVILAACFQVERGVVKPVGKSNDDGA